MRSGHRPSACGHEPALRRRDLGAALAAIFGLWGGRLDESATFGNKEVQRIDLKGKDTGFTIKSSGYMEHSPEDPSVLHILCGVYPRPEKGRPADESVPQTHSDSKFHGELTIGKLTEE